MFSRTSHLLLFIPCLMPLLAHATTRPEWVDRPPSEDSEFKYYVGRASLAPTDADAVYQTMNDARKQAIGENFGVYVQFQSDVYRSADATSASQIAQELSGLVRLDGFQKKDLYLDRTDHGINAWELYKYPQAEITKEKARLAKLRAKFGDEPFKLNDYGFAGNEENMGFLEVHSHPEGLKIRIDTHSEVLGKTLVTPLRIGLTAGHHIVVIDDPKFRLHQEEVTLMPAGTALVDVVMERAFGTLTIKTDPSQAAVSIGTLTVKSPTDAIRVPAGVPILIQVNHPEAKSPFQEEVTLERNESQTKNYSLDLKPALLSINSEPGNAEIEVDDRPMGLTQATVEVSAHIPHHILIKKSGYASLTDDIVPVDGGATKIVPSYILIKSEERAPATVLPTSEIVPNQSEARREEIATSPLTDRTFWLGVRAGYMGSTTSQLPNSSGSGGVFGEYRLTSWLALELGADMGARDDSYSNGQLWTYKYNFEAGLPISLLWFNENKTRLFIEPQYFNLITHYDFIAPGSSPGSGNNPTAPTSTQSQHGPMLSTGMDFYTGMAGKAPAYLRITIGAGKPNAVGAGTSDATFFTGSIGMSFGLGGGK